MIFVDSSYYIARLIEKDKFHKRSIELEPQLNEKRYINNTVLNEILNSFRHYGGQDITKLFHYLNDMNDLVYLTEKDYIESVNISSHYGSSINFSDCTILQSMQNLGVNKIVSFDSDFKKIDGIVVID
ncbi:MAG: type II toxin-antitoxin system VapC family toxin [Methanobrevibacter sp.]|nr:type II toxin-antitoxin system VapC family toxin [Methanobrevibacter sp.]